MLRMLLLLCSPASTACATAHVRSSVKEYQVINTCLITGSVTVLKNKLTRLCRWWSDFLEIEQNYPLTIGPYTNYIFYEDSTYFFQVQETEHQSHSTGGV